MTTQAQDPEQAEATTSPENPEATTEAPTIKVRRPGFRKEESNPSSNDPSPEAATDAGSEAGGAFPGPSEQMPDDEPTKSGGSRTSSRADKAALRKAVAVGFAGATTGAHAVLVRDPYAKQFGVLLADKDDVQAVAAPASNLLARRMGDVPLGGDLGDVVELIVAVAGYALKQIEKFAAARNWRNSGGVIEGLQPDDTHGEQPDDEQPPAFVPQGI